MVGEIIEKGDVYIIDGKRVPFIYSIGHIRIDDGHKTYRPLHKKKVQRRIDMEAFMLDLGLDTTQRHFMKSMIYNNFRRRKKSAI